MLLVILYFIKYDKTITGEGSCIDILGGKRKKLKKIQYNNKMEKYTLSVDEPWFSLISLKLKTIEGRLNKGLFKKMEIGDIVKWTNDKFGSRSVLTKIINKTEYKTFEEYLTDKTLEKCLPSIKEMNNGLGVYFTYYTKEQESEFGVVAITLEVIKD